MRVIFDIGHPADVHLFKYTMWDLQKSGFELKIVVRPKEINQYLLDSYGFKYDTLNNYSGPLRKLFGLMANDFKYYKIAKDFKPDLFVGPCSPLTAHISTLLGKPYIAFVDTNSNKTDIFYFSHFFLTMPLTDVICTQTDFPMQLNPKKHISYRGYHELAYLHPNYFKPDPGILSQLNLTVNDKFIILRFAAWDAVHDIGHRGFKNTKEIIKFVEMLKTKCKVFVTSEVDIPELNEYKLTIAAEKIHHLLAFATMYIGEGATMASEAGVLGVPWIFIYTKRLCYLDDQEKNYGLGYTISNSKEALPLAFNIIEDNNIKNVWSKKRKRLLQDKIDVTEFMKEFIKNYPRSFHEYRKGGMLVTKP